MEIKKIIRKNILSKLSAMDEKIHKKRSEKLVNAFVQTPIFKTASTIGVTISRFPEINTSLLIQLAHLHNKKIAIPETLYPERTMQFRVYQPGDQLIKKNFNLLEPIESSPVVPPTEIDLLIVPGVAYTKKGYRIGFGGGFYDKYLTVFEGETLSLVFKEQLIGSFEVEQHDKSVNILVID